MKRRKPGTPAVDGSGALELPREVELRLGVHDLSRIEWTCAVLLPDSGDRKYEVGFNIEIPSNLYQQQNVWDNLQSFTRLQSPTEQGQIQIERADIDELRRDTLGIAHRLKQQRFRFERTCVSAATALIEALHPSLQGKLREILDGAVSVVAEMRDCLHAPVPETHFDEHQRDLEREWELADEFLSHQLLDFLAASQKAIDEVLLGDASRVRELGPAWTEEIRDHLAVALENELAHRDRHRFRNPHAESPAELSRFVERAGALKKHFQDVLFLDAETYMVDYRLRNWTGVVAASLAATFWFAFIIFFPTGVGAKAGVSLGIAAGISSIGYALKDRIKELARGWLAGRLTRLYGQRSLRLKLPPRLDPHRPVLVEARETFDAEAILSEDALNRRVGRTRRVTRLGYRMRAHLSASTKLERAGIDSIKHIFRFDVSSIFSRLDNAVKSVPVLDQATHRVRFADAPKEYRFPISISAEIIEGGTPRTFREDAVVVLSKRGVGRIETA